MAETPEQFFDRHSAGYDEAIERCVPRYQEMRAALLDAVPSPPGPRRILELGCGTGSLTAELLRRWPAAQVLAVDLSREALRVAEERLGRHPELTLQVAPMEFLRCADGSFDLVISCIAVHHLTHEHKAELVQRVHRWLVPGGVLLIADQCAGATARLDQQHKAAWHRLATAQGLSAEEWGAWREHEAQHDHHATVSWHFQALGAAGFTEVDCVWRHLLWTVLFARNPLVPAQGDARSGAS